MSTATFGEVITAMVTPFAEDGALSLDRTRSLARYLVEHGSDGLVVCGTTGEAPALRHDEKRALFEAVVDEVGGDEGVSVIAGTGTPSTSETIDLTIEAASSGVDACLVVTPYYSKPPQNGLLAHFTAVADASPVPVIVYDIPSRTGRRVELQTMLELARHERIVGVKDAVDDPAETAALRAGLDDQGTHDFEIYSGSDVLLLPHLAAGATGIISVVSQLVAPRMKQIFAAWADGKVEEARRIFVELVPFMNVIMSVTSNPIPVKAALGMIGVDVGPPRLPLVEPTEEEAAVIRAAMDRIGLL